MFKTSYRHTVAQSILCLNDVSTSVLRQLTANAVAYDRPPFGTTQTISGLLEDDFEILTVGTAISIGPLAVHVAWWTLQRKMLNALFTVRRPCPRRSVRSLR